MTQIPGQFISSVGGLVGFAPYAGNRTPDWGSGVPAAPPSASQVTYLDVADWQLQITPFFDDTTNTGSYGAQNMDLVAEGFQAVMNVIVDQNRPPDMLAKYGVFTTKASPVSFNTISQYEFNLGTRLTLIQGAGANYPYDPNNVNQDFWWCPSVKRAQVTPIIDANAKKMVRMRITVQGNARIFKLPAEYQVLADYITHLASWNQVF
jgi:hypothetical protein